MTHAVLSGCPVWTRKEGREEGKKEESDQIKFIILRQDKKKIKHKILSVCVCVCVRAVCISLHDNQSSSKTGGPGQP